MKRRSFTGGALGLVGGLVGVECSHAMTARELAADVVIIGGSLGGCAAALAALERGLRVILTEETDWIGGQLTSQGVPPDEHPWIESHGASKSYRKLREDIRAYYRNHYQLTEESRQVLHFNPGNGSVSRLCAEPRVALAVIQAALAPYQSSGQLIVLLGCVGIAADLDGDLVKHVTVRHLLHGNQRVLSAPHFVDGTELGDLLSITKTEHVTGAEGRAATNEPHAPVARNPQNQQAFTMCFALDHLPGEEHLIEKPEDYAFWRDHVPTLQPAWSGKLLDWHYTHPRSGQRKKLGFNPEGDQHDGVVNLWSYRRIVARSNFTADSYQSDITLVNWPQNDYMLQPLVNVSEEDQKRAIKEAKQLSLSLLYWMQTEAPRIDGGQGFPGLRLRADVMGTQDGMAKYPYVREARRIVAETTIREQDCGIKYPDSIGIGYYPIDLHPTTAGDNYIDFDTKPFQIPLGALLPQRMENVLPACKNIGTTHVTNGCYRLHPVEWSIGEAVGALVAFAQSKRTTPRAVRGSARLLEEFQQTLTAQGVELAWPSDP